MTDMTSTSTSIH